MIVDVENLKESTRKILLRQISTYSKVAKYTGSIWKSIASLYTRDEQVKFETTDTVSFTLSTSKNELDKNLIKYIQDLYKEKCKTLMK